MQFKLDELAKFLAITQKVFLKAEESFRRLAKVQMTGDRLKSHFDAVYPRSEEQKKNGRKPQRWSFVQDVFERRPDLQIHGLHGRFGPPTMPSPGLRITSNRSSRNCRNNAWSGRGLAEGPISS
jgi:hypothetical protein